MVVEKKSKHYKALIFLSILYVSIMIAANVLIYRLTCIGELIISVGTFIIPFWYVLNDIITEVYGYQVIRRIIWSSLSCVFIFSLICILMIKLPTPPNWHYQHAYDLVLGNLFRVFFGMIIAVVVGSFLNTYLISKWKIFIKGRHFWLRSIGSSGIGQFLFTFIAIVFDLIGTVPMKTLVELIIISYIIKLIFTPLAALPSALIAQYLKKLEGIDIYDHDTNFNLFKLEIN